MNRGHTDEARSSGRRATVLAAVIAVALPAAALAQTNTQPPSDSQALDQQPKQSPWPAPVGHRQPRPSDLPPSVLRAEDGGGETQGQGEGGGKTRGQADIDKDLQICKGC
jgi:hypothetical protein